MRLSRRSHPARLRAALLASSALIAAPAAAQDATWNLNPTVAGPFASTFDFNANSNWTPGTAPTGTATFGATNSPNLSFSAATTNIGTMQFNAGAPAYNFSLATQTLNINGIGAGGGIVNNSANAPTFTLFPSGVVNFNNSSTAGNASISNFNLTFGSVNFLDSSSAGNATLTSNNGGLGLSFKDSSTAANSKITVTGLTGNPGTTLFLDASTAGNAKITVSGTDNSFGAGSLVFGDPTFVTGPHTSNAGTATITNNQFGFTSFLSQTSAATATIINNSGGGTNFQEQSTAFNANITNKAGAFLFFGDQSTAGNATIVNSGTMTFGFNFGFGDTATAGDATITTKNGGRVEFFDSTSGGAAKFITETGGVFDMSGLAAGGMTAGSIEGGGSYVLGSKKLVVGGNNLSTEVSGVISGVGGRLEKVGTGTLILSGINTYTGGTFNCACSTLQLGTMSSMGSILGDVTNEGIFNVVNANTTGITSITNKLGGETHFFNTTSASSAVIVNNDGFTTFHDNSTAGNSDITNRNGGTTEFRDNSTASHATITNRAFSTTEFYNTSTAGSAVITNNGGATLFFDQSTAGSADITNRNGGVTVFGDIGGTDTASAGNAKITNRETGGETIFQAFTTAGNATITNNGGVTSFFDNSNAGSANINNRNGGLTVFADNTSAANATIINQNGSLFLGPSTTVFSGNSTAANASITNQTFGLTLFVDGANGGNATIVNNAGGATFFGTAQFTDAPSAGNAKITNNNGGETDFQAFSTAANATITTNSGGATVFFDNATGGNAQFITNAGGIVDFSQTIGLAGDKKVSAGSIAGAGDYYLGGVELTVGSNNLSTTVSGTLHDGVSSFFCGCVPPSSGASLVKVGIGTLTLAGINTYTGATTVNAGTLIVNGSIVASSGLTVNAGGTVGGTGNLPKTTINGGSLSPGNSIGTITVNNSLSFVGPGNYIVEVSPTAADKTNVVGAPGTASLAGMLSAIGTGGTYTVGTKYTVLNATGSVNGTFASLAISGNFGITKPHIEYDANNVYLVLDPNALSLAGLTPNQKAVAAAVNTAVTGGSQIAPIFALFGLTPAQLPGALDQLSGEVHASTVGVLLDESLYPRSAVLGRLRQASYGGDASMASLGVGGPQAFAGGQELTALAYDKSPIVTKAPPLASRPSYDVVFWAQGFGARGKFDTDGNAANVTRNLAGFFSGVDTRVGANGRAGVMTGYTASNNTLDGRGNANVETGHLAGYGGWSFGALNLRAGAAAAWHTIDTSRTVNFPGFFDSLTAHYDGRTGQVFGEAGYGFALGRIAVEPFAGGAWVNVKTDGTTERGGLAALAVASSSFTVGYSTLGVRAASMIPLANDMVLVPRVSVAWQHAFGDVTPDARLALIAAPVPFVIAGVPIARDSLLSEAGIDLAVGRHATVGVSYTGQLARNVQDHAAKGKFSWKF